MDRLDQNEFEKLDGKEDDILKVSEAAISQNAKESILGDDDLFGADDDIITTAAQESESIAAYKKVQASQQSQDLDLQDEVKATEDGYKKSSFRDKPVGKASFDDKLIEEDALEPKDKDEDTHTNESRANHKGEEEEAPTTMKVNNNSTKGGKSRGKSKGKKQSVVESEQTNQEEEPEEEYEIEQIVAHRIYKGKVVKYEIKWKGYDSSENTMENANTIHTDVYDLCAAYWDGHDQRPINAPKSKDTPVTKKPEAKRKRSIAEVESDYVEEKEEPASSTTAASTTASASQAAHANKRAHKKQLSQHLEHVPQYMSDKGYQYPTTWPNSKTRWDADMKSFSAIQVSPQDKSVKMAYIDWNNGQKTIHTLEECHEKCPLQLIRYYEERLQFV